MTTVGSLVYQFFEHHLKAEKGLSQASIRSYRDGIRLFLLFLAKTTHRPISKLALSDLGAHNVRDFLAHLEAERGNGVRSRNHRLAMLHTFFVYVGAQTPELLREAEQVAAIPTKRTQPPRPVISNVTRSSLFSPTCRARDGSPFGIAPCSSCCTTPARARPNSSA